MSRRFAVFDIDGTLIRWQLYHAIVSELAKDNHLGKAAYELIQGSRAQWKSRSHSESFKEYERALVQAYYKAITKLDVIKYNEVVDKVFEEYKDQVYTYTRDLVLSLKKSGTLLFCISGSHQEIIDKLASYYGFDAAIGNYHERKNGKFTGEHRHVVENKAQLLDDLVKKFNATYKGSIGIGDSEGDISLLSKVERPIAFNPSHLLFKHAEANGWKIVVERKNQVYELEKISGKYVLA